MATGSPLGYHCGAREGQPMARVACVFVVLCFASAARAADLPPGALARLGDDRFRAGGEIEHLALSPDGKQFATARCTDLGLHVLTVWDAATGRPLREQQVNSELFKGFVWNEGRAFAVATRADPGPRDGTGKLYPDDFRAWVFTDPKAEGPPIIPVTMSFKLGTWLSVTRPVGGPEYTAFRLSANGTRVAALWKSAGGDRHAVHVFDLKAASSTAQLNRARVLDLGAEGADHVRIAADGNTVVTFRKLANADAPEMTATTWTVATGKPVKPVRVPAPNRLMLTPDARGLVVLRHEEDDWGFDLHDLATGKRRELSRWPYTAAQRDGDYPRDMGGFAFTPSGRELIVAHDNTAIVLDLTTGKERGRFAGHASDITAVAVSADGARVATGDLFGLVRLWDAKTLRALTDAPGHRAKVEHAQLSPDGMRLLTWAADRTVRLWDIASGKELRAFAGATDDSPPLFSPDGTAVVYYTKDKLLARDLQTGLEVPLPKNADKLEPREALHETARMWAREYQDPYRVVVYEGGTHNERCTLIGHRGGTHFLGFTPDGTKLLTAGGDHTVLVWDMRLAHVPLPDALKKETDAAKLWKMLADGKAEAAYLAMARLAREPDAAVKLLRMKLTPAKKGETSDGTTDARAIELLEALDTADARALLKELAGGHADAFRTQEANRALARAKR
jgi:WD40 repeat protein